MLVEVYLFYRLFNDENRFFFLFVLIYLFNRIPSPYGLFDASFLFIYISLFCIVFFTQFLISYSKLNFFLFISLMEHQLQLGYLKLNSLLLVARKRNALLVLYSHLHHHSASQRHNMKDRRRNEGRMIKTHEGRKTQEELRCRKEDTKRLLLKNIHLSFYCKGSKG